MEGGDSLALDAVDVGVDGVAGDAESRPDLVARVVQQVLDDVTLAPRALALVARRAQRVPHARRPLLRHRAPQRPHDNQRSQSSDEWPHHARALAPE